MTNTEMFKSMLNMQIGFNDTLNKDWISFDRFHDRDDWLAASLECAELIEHLGEYKWWKKTEPDFNQARMEAVDIFHFHMSALLREGCSAKLPKEFYLSEDSVIREAAVQELLPEMIDVTASLFSGCFDEDTLDIEHVKDISITDLAALFMASAITASNEHLFIETNREIKAGTFDVSDFQENITSHMKGNIYRTALIFPIMKMLGIETVEKLYLMYIGKNVLNKFRQDNGYSDGFYIKTWFDQEDNEVLTSFLAVLTRSSIKLDSQEEAIFIIQDHLNAQYKLVMGRAA